MFYGWTKWTYGKSYIDIPTITATGDGIAQSGDGALGPGPDRYKGVRTCKVDGYSFSVPVTITAKSTVKTYTNNYTNNNNGRTFNINIVSGNSKGYRDFAVKYIYATNCDIRSLGYDFENVKKKTYDTVHTTLDMSDANLIYPDIDWEVGLNTAYPTYEAVMAHVLLKPYLIQPQNHKVYLCAINNAHYASNALYNTNEDLPEINTGTAINVVEPSGSAIIKYAICVILAKRAINIDYPQFTATQKAKWLDEVVFHELGHARGLLFTAAAGYYDHNITSNDHTGGHDGVNKAFCLMRSAADNSYTWENFEKSLELLDYCTGHKQMLFNANF